MMDSACRCTSHGETLLPSPALDFLRTVCLFHGSARTALTLEALEALEDESPLNREFESLPTGPRC